MPWEPKVKTTWCHCPAATVPGEPTVSLTVVLCSRVCSLPSLSMVIVR